MIDRIKIQQHKMNLCSIKCSEVYKQQLNENKTWNWWKINLYCYFADCGFKKFETIDKEELSDLLKSLNYILNNFIALFKV